MLTLDPTAPLLWRSPTAVQLGVAPVLAVLTEVGVLEEAVLAALRRGATTADLRRLGRPEAVAALLERVRPALMTARADRPAPVRPVLPRPGPAAVDGPADLVRSIGGALRLLGHPDRDPGGPGTVVLAAHHVLVPHRAARWIADDVPHLPVVLLDQAAVVGPLVVPGRTPCLRCGDEHRLDEDAAWSAIGAQLLRRRPAVLAEDPRMLAEVTAMLGRALDGDPAVGPLAGVQVRIDGRTGAISRLARPWHERCLCRSLAAPTPTPKTAIPLPTPDAARPGTGTGVAALDAGPSPHRRAAAAAAPA